MSQRTKPYRPGAMGLQWGMLQPGEDPPSRFISPLNHPPPPLSANPTTANSGKDSTTEAGAHSLSQHQDSLTIDEPPPSPTVTLVDIFPCFQRHSIAKPQADQHRVRAFRVCAYPPLCHMYPPRFRHFHLSHMLDLVLSIKPMMRPIRATDPVAFPYSTLLYQAPVESDIQSKSAADKNSAEARSSIRRSRLQNSERVQQRRRRLAITAAINSGNAAAAAGNNHDNLRRRSPPAERSSGSNSDSNSNNAPNNAESSRDTTRDGASRIGGMLDDQVIALFGRRLAHLHSLSQYPGALTDDEDPEPNPFLAHMTAEPPFAHMAVEPGFLSRRVPPPPPPPVEPRTSSQMNRGPPTPIRERAALRRIRDRTADRASSLYGTWGNPYPRPDAMSGRRRGEQAPSVDAPQVDGLGDRNRSLSPEGDHVWDIFTTTLTPDPLTPSSGSSFASVSASAVASQNAAAPSVGTSVTVPDVPVEVAEAEPPCESGGENSDTEGDEDDELDVNPLTRFPLAPSLNSIRRSYADVTRNDSSDDSLEILGGMGGLQRIVRNLATREDVPDEWWAEAGLSRMLSRGASGN
ncbi:uncharacterized protein B0T23DRAFT_409624 [Neurospora hispaniola]|uniref:Uncharacterized protein n=1 Tax=Neurospora hispaniola TaxID=588809 RepID=A0AAJ0IG09_9PEZI|nr:hypothetical protein B0T23DRAFT_409624 [Neurospora hispaniola]